MSLRVAPRATKQSPTNLGGCFTRSLRSGFAMTSHCFIQNHPHLGYIYGVNLNLGCPDQQVIKEGNGSALLKRPSRVRELIKAFLISETRHVFHFSVKFRLGFTEEDMKSLKFVEILRKL